MKKKCTRSLLTILLMSLLMSLVSARSVAQTYFESSVSEENAPQLDKILILHLGEDFDIRKTVEGELTYWLNKYKFEASPSHRYFENQLLPTKERIIKALKENNFDGVLTTSFVTIEEKERYENPQSAYDLTPNSPTFFNFLDSYQNQYSMGYTVMEKSFVVETQLFRTADEKNLYKASTETYQPETLDLAVEAFSKAIAKDIKKSKVLKKQK